MHFDNGKKISIFADRFVPAHVKENYPQFVNFVKAFLEYVERDLGEWDLIVHMRDYADIDNTVSAFIAEYRKQYGAYLPENIEGDLKIIIKNIRSFYLSKGTKESYEFLFSAVFDTFVNFYFPKEDILRCSDGTWVLPVFLISTGQDFSLFLDKEIEGAGGATGYAQSVQLIEIPPMSGNPLVPALRVINFNGTFSDNEAIIIQGEVAGSTFTTDAVNGVLEGEGEWLDDKGFLSWNKYIQDSNYYQEYSYEIRSEIGIVDYKKIVEETIHPAGFKIFAVVSFEEYQVSRMPCVEPVDEVTPIDYHNNYLFTQCNMETFLFRCISWMHVNYNDLQIGVTQDGFSNTVLSRNMVRSQPLRAFDYIHFQDNREQRQKLAYTIEALEEVVIDEFEIRLGKYNIMPFIDGVKVHLDDYGVNNNTLSLTSVLGVNEKLNILYMNSRDYLPEVFLGSVLIANAYAMIHNPISDENVLVFKNGIKLVEGTEYTILGSVITFTSSTPTDELEIIHLDESNIPTSTHESIVADGVTKIYSLGASTARKRGENILVTVDGQIQTRGKVYDVTPDGQTLVFGLPYIPGALQIIDITYLHNTDYTNQKYIGNGLLNDYQLERVGEIFPYVPVALDTFDA